ncbi:MAG: VWA domain-containing protein [Lentimicrobiaceae bacterium]|jgi:Ca-activated chloride channel family protein
MFRLAHPLILYLLLVIPLLVLLFVYARRRKKKALSAFGDLNLVLRLIPEYSGSREILKFIIWTIAWALIVIGLADPQTGSKLEKIKRQGIDMIFALDVSNSMLAQDITPNRLERAKQAIIHLLGKLDNDRVGLVIFAGKSYIQMPLTTDYSATRLFLSNINPGMIPVQGTAIGDAIETSASAFGNNKQSKAIILITDGENHEDNAIEAAQAVAAKGIRVYTIGIGIPEGAPIPVYSGNTQIGYKKDAQGITIITRLDEPMLRDIAKAGKGIFVRANNSQSGVQEVFDQINKLEKAEYNEAFFSDYEDRFQFFILAALILILGEVLIADRKGRLAGKIKLFNTKNATNQ